MRPIRAAVLLSFLSKSFSRHSFSYARVKISECATGATVHYTQVSPRDNRPCNAGGMSNHTEIRLSSNLSDFKQFEV